MKRLVFSLSLSFLATSALAQAPAVPDAGGADAGGAGGGAMSESKFLASLSPRSPGTCPKRAPRARAR